jgi:hypothetical protein
MTLREHLVELLCARNAHADLEAALAGFPAAEAQNHGV